ncbi:MAG: hypothetical protein Kow0099_08570 [Candidatus Abyssubacteria bacterium]
METAERQEKVRCSLCGTEFSPDEHKCGGCALRKNCEIICCPNCGFGFPRESSMVTWLKKQFGKKRSEKN